MRVKNVRAGALYLLVVFVLLLAACGGGGGGGNQPISNSSINPLIKSVYPSPNSTGIPVNAAVTATFSSVMNAATINGTTFIVNGPGGQVPGSVNYDPSSRTATFTPTSLIYNTVYTTTLTSGIEDASGNPLSPPVSWSFTTAPQTFWALNFVNNTNYLVNATMIGEGQHCYIYLANGQTVSQSTVNAIIKEFDNYIYPGDTGAFGSEPNPGVDNDPKIYILLLDIQDGYSSNPGAGYIAGYFDPTNEYPSTQYRYSNVKEMFYMDTNPGLSKAPIDQFYDTLAHEFQHMIHWEQKVDQRHLTNSDGLPGDDTWIDEGFSQVARTFCGLDPSYWDVQTYESMPWHSLTNWTIDLQSYAVVYMWSQYMKDTFNYLPLNNQHTIFWTMLHNPYTGIDEVNNALSTIGSSKTFTDVFRDWSVAILSGNSVSWDNPPHPEWSYTSINTWPGNYSENGQSVLLPGLFSSSNENLSTLTPLDMWSMNFYRYTKSGIGNVVWTRSNSNETASFVNSTGWDLNYAMTSGAHYPYTDTGYLIDQNPSGNPESTGDSVAYTSIVGSTGSTGYLTPKQMLDMANSDPVLIRRYRKTGRPMPICVNSFFAHKEQELRAQGLRPVRWR